MPPLMPRWEIAVLTMLFGSAELMVPWLRSPYSLVESTVPSLLMVQVPGNTRPGIKLVVMKPRYGPPGFTATAGAASGGAAGFAALRDSLRVIISASATCKPLGKLLV